MGGVHHWRIWSEWVEACGDWNTVWTFHFPTRGAQAWVDHSFSRTIDRVVASQVLLLVTTYLDNKPISNGHAPDSKTFKPLVDFICAIVSSSDTFTTLRSAGRPKIDRAQYLDHDSRYIGLVDRSEFRLWEVEKIVPDQREWRKGVPPISGEASIFLLFFIFLPQINHTMWCTFRS